jgi:GDP-L-fucose synthase
MKKKIKKIFIAGHNGLLGKALFKKLKKNNQLIIADRNKLDLINQFQVKKFFKQNKFDEVYIAAAKVGGIMANNTYPAEFIYNNTMIATNLINSSFEARINKLIFVGSSCIYPKLSPLPIKENALLTGPLEKTNEAYAIAKIMGIKLCQYYNKQYETDFRSVMLTNLYGPNDNFDNNNSHVIPALISKLHNAKVNNLKEIKLWGTGKPLREFLFIEDAADAIIKSMNVHKLKYSQICGNDNIHLNIGFGKQISIKELSKIISKIIDYKGKIKWDRFHPDGTPAKILNSNRIKKINWKPKISLENGLKKTYSHYLKSQKFGL